MLTLLFRVSEKTATPTTGSSVDPLFCWPFMNESPVVVRHSCLTGLELYNRDAGQVHLDGWYQAALNSHQRSFVTRESFAGMEQEALDYFWVSASIVSVGAPLGSFLSSFVHRILLSIFLYVADVVQFVAALIIIPMTKPYVPVFPLLSCPTSELIHLSLWADRLVILVLGILTLSFGLFFGLTKLGDVLMLSDQRLLGGDVSGLDDEDDNDESVGSRRTPPEENTKILKIQPIYG